MGNRGFIEPPPGLFGNDDDDQGRDQAHQAHERPAHESEAPRFTIRTERGTAPIPPMPRLTPPPAPAPSQPAPAPSQPETAQFAPQAPEQLRAFAPAPSWVRPPADRHEQPFPSVPRLASPAAPTRASAPEAPRASRVVAPEAPSLPGTSTGTGDGFAPDAATTTGIGTSTAAEVHATSSSLPDWSLVLSDGVAVPLYGPVVVGRNPSGEQFPGATLAAVPDPTRTMSKTHARFYLDDGVPMVDDLGSTNGIALFPGGNAQGAMAVEPGSPTEVRSGDVVQLGEYEISVRRN